MRIRIISGLAAVALFLPVIIFSDTVFFNILIALVSLMALYEVLIATKYLKNKSLIAMSAFMAVMIPFAPMIRTALLFPLVLILAIGLFIILIYHFPEITLERISVVFLLSLIIPYFYTNLILIAGMECGTLLVPLVLIGAFATDTFAYFTGYFIGKRKLAPVISPKKTVEGSAGGVAGALLCSVIYGIILTFFEYDVNFIWLGACALVCAAVSQLGDLSMSAIKRQFDIKDFGSVMPGHGGVLDRLDSMLFAAPVMYAMYMLVPVIR